MADNNTTKKRKYGFSETHSARKRMKAAKDRARRLGKFRRQSECSEYLSPRHRSMLHTNCKRFVRVCRRDARGLKRGHIAGVLTT